MHDKILLMFLFGIYLACMGYFVVDYAHALKERRELTKDLDHAHAHIRRQNKEIEALKKANFDVVAELVALMVAHDLTETDK